MNGDETHAGLQLVMAHFIILLYIFFRFEAYLHIDIAMILLHYCYIAALGPRVLAVTDAMLKSDYPSRFPSTAITIISYRRRRRSYM